MKVSVQYAESHWADLIAAASQGQEVEIEIPEKPALLLSRKERAIPVKQSSRRNRFGMWEDLVTLPTNEEWSAMDKEIEGEFDRG